jgi:hypothetical protein
MGVFVGSFERTLDPLNNLPRDAFVHLLRQSKPAVKRIHPAEEQPDLPVQVVQVIEPLSN